MLAIEFYIFSALVLIAAFLSVVVRHVLYASFCQTQAVVAIAGVMAGLNAKFVAFALLSMSAASILVFLMFALIVFDFRQSQNILPQRASVVSFGFFGLLACETVYLFFKPQWGFDKSAESAKFSLAEFGNILYDSYGLCVLIFGVLLLSCMAGATSLLVSKTQEYRS